LLWMIRFLLDGAEEPQAEAARMPQTDGTGDGRSKPQPYHLPPTVTNERTLARLPSRDMHRYPLRRAHELDGDVPINPAPQQLATDLIDYRLPFALLGTPKMMTGRYERSH
jgi:hypothetical protein